jgi:hypothetical protein
MEKYKMNGYIDYQITNLQCFIQKLSDKQISLSNPTSFYVFPYQLMEYENKNSEKMIDCGFITADNSPKRLQIYRQLLTKGIKVQNINGWGMMRDNLLFRCKVLVNVHHNDEYNIYESLRCDRCIYNKVIVISETSYRDDLDDDLKLYRITVPYNKIAETVEIVVQNYELLYNNFTFDGGENILNKEMIDIETPVILGNIKILPYSYHRYWDDGEIKYVYHAGGNTPTKFERIKNILI